MIKCEVGSFANPIYFTAMIGMIALAGIATRNAILLIEFVEERKKRANPSSGPLARPGLCEPVPYSLLQ